MAEKIIPDKTLQTNVGKPNEGLWEFYGEEKLGITAITYNQKDTGAVLATVHGNPNMRTASHIAWAGARHSRAPGDTVEILQEMGQKGVDPDQKLEDTFKNYGHASVADMARVAVQFNNVPMHVPMNLFNETVINSGQEKSTRYQKQFSGAILHPLGLYLHDPSPQLVAMYESLGRLSLETFGRQKPIITQAYEEFYKPTIADANSSKAEIEQAKKEKSSLDSRVLDTIRFNLLLGQSTGFALETSARDWSKIISHMKGSEMSFYQNLGQHLETMLAPDAYIEEGLGFKAEAPSLIRHTKADTSLSTDLRELKKYMDAKDLTKHLFSHSSPLFVFSYEPQGASLLDSQRYSATEKMVAQYFLAAHPGGKMDAALELAKNLPPDMREDISSIIFIGHSHQKELPQQLATTEETTIAFEGTLGELRDFNRHRAWGRFLQHAPLYNGPQVERKDFDRILDLGFGLPLYVTEIEQLSELGSMMEKDLVNYYTKVLEFENAVHKEYGDSANYYFMMNLLPLAHRSNILMHGNVKQAHYLSHLRVRPGGHINYRALTHDAAQMISETDLYLARLMPVSSKPDPAGREEFFGRS
jgi:thymidylate synthase ThyX